MVKRSDYRPVIDRYLNLVGEDRLLILPLEMLSEDPGAYLSRLHTFLDLSTEIRIDEASARVRPSRNPRSGGMARVAKTAALKLRRLGYLRALGALKESKAVNNLLFRERKSGAVEESPRGASLELDALSDAYPELLARYG